MNRQRDHIIAAVAQLRGLLRDRILDEDVVYYSTPNFEEFNFSKSERERIASSPRLQLAGKPRRARVPRPPPPAVALMITG